MAQSMDMAEALGMSKGHCHFIGIGGIGMSALAQVTQAKGWRVTGSDIVAAKTFAMLEARGIELFVGHRPENVAGADVVVWSTAVSRENPERLRAMRSSIPCMHRAEWLAEIFRAESDRDFTLFAVAGAHGKTTCTNMLFHVLRAAQIDASLVSGGIDMALGSNAHVGKDPIAVVEADESDGSLLRLNPTAVLCTNIDSEHMEHYKDWESLKATFATFLGRVPEKGWVAYWDQDKALMEIAGGLRATKVSFGVHPFSRIRGESKNGALSVWEGDTRMGDLRLGMAGEHNALGVTAMARLWGVSWDAIRMGLQSYRGTQRRLELKGEMGGVLVVDDYAHHPTEVRASLQALRASSPGRIVVVFQPHRYSRLASLEKGFAESFDQADEVILTPVYAAGETNQWGVRVDSLAALIRQRGRCQVHVAEGWGRIVLDLQRRLTEKDIVVGMGAGDVHRLSGMLLEALGERAKEHLPC